MTAQPSRSDSRSAGAGLDGGDIEAMALEVSSLIREGGISFQRGEPLAYVRKLARLNSALTLPIVPSERHKSAVLAKVLYATWNIVVDDEMDRTKTTHGLDDAIAFLLGRRDTRSGPNALLWRLAELTPGGSIRREEPLGIDLWEVVQGLNYEWFLNHSPEMGISTEYRRHSTMTASLKVLLDVDCLFSRSVLEPSAYRALREAYDEMTCAVKLAGDVGTLHREVHEEDNVNLLRILARSGDAGGSTGGSPDEQMASALRFKEEVSAWSRGHMKRATEYLCGIGSLDATGVLAAVGRIVEVYLSGVDPFFDRA